jgi:site-specific DNA recombinase
VLHRALMMVLGAQSQREVLRSRHRVLGAMRAQVMEQGRFLGGRPPYGYRLIDAGPHPNRATARWGRRLHRLAPDSVTARHVRWMFGQRLAGRSLAGIARELNERGVPCPSGVDRKRNPHRSGEGWTLGSVASILANPRYTGRQVWNRQTTDHDHHTPAGQRRPAYRWNAPQDWVFSKKIVHAALVSEEDFLAVQSMRAARPTSGGGVRRYQLSGLVRCGVCGRRMDSHWVHDRPGYRCRHGQNSSKQRPPDASKILYVREDVLVARVAVVLADQGVAEPLSPGAAVAHLRASMVLVTYGPGACTLEPDTEACQHKRRSSSSVGDLDLVW